MLISIGIEIEKTRHYSHTYPTMTHMASLGSRDCLFEDTEQKHAT